MLDVKTLILCSFVSLIILTITALILFYKFPQEKYFKYFALFPLSFFAGEFLRYFRIVIPDFFAVVVANTLMASGIVFLYLGVRSILNLEAKWQNRYYIPISMIFLGFSLFTYVHYDVAMRIIIFSTFTIIYGSAITWLFFKNATKRFRTVDYISGVLLFIGVSIFVIRMFKATIIELNVNYPKVTDLMNTFIYVYLFFMTIWLSVILIIRAIPLFTLKNSTDTNE